MAEASGAGEAHQRTHHGTRTAPVYHIPTTRIVALEHPGIVRNFDNGFKSLGGEAQLKHVLEHRVGDSKHNNKQNEHPEPVAGVSLRPNDPLAKKIPSTGIDTQNVLIKVIIPKRTGRKRKRGSDEPFVKASSGPEMPNTSITAPDLLQRLRDNQGKYSVEAVGMLHETHRFRGLPDFQLRNADVPLMRHLRDHAMIPDYDRFKHFRVDLSTKPIRHTALPGPPAFTTTDMPHKFEYRQPDSIVFVQDATGQLTTKNLSSAYKRFVTAFPPDVDEVPARCPQDPPNWGANGNEVPKVVALIRKLLEERPIVTKRVALNNLPSMSDTVFKEATQYAGYSFKAGPFRDSLIRYGVDPRKDPQYRFYQTLMFQLDNQAFKSNAETLKVGLKPGKDHSSRWARPLRHTRDDPTTHMFDGRTVTANGKTWQVCDVTDPLVHSIFHTADIRTDCDVHTHGWFHNGTIGKARAIMKDKMIHLFKGSQPPEESYQHLAAAIPEEITSANLGTLSLDAKVYGEHAMKLVGTVKGIAKSADLKMGRMKRLVEEEEDGGDDHGEGGSSGGGLRNVGISGDEDEDDSVQEGDGDFEGGGEDDGEEHEQDEGNKNDVPGDGPEEAEGQGEREQSI